MDDSYKHPVDEKKVRFRPNIVGTKKENLKWIISITIISFITSALLSFISSAVLEEVSNIIALFVVLIIIFIGIIFDIIGIAVTSADEVPFHAMASRKHYGAKKAIKLIRNASKVSSFCNDVVGDICGVISGAASASIILRLAQKGTVTPVVAGLIISGIVAAVTIGGKAIGKTFAIGYSSYIVYKVGVIVQFATSILTSSKNSNSMSSGKSDNKVNKKKNSSNNNNNGNKNSKKGKIQ